MYKFHIMLHRRSENAC